MIRNRASLLTLTLLPLLLATPLAAQEDEEESGFTYVSTDDGHIVVRRIVNEGDDPKILFVGDQKGEGHHWIGGWENRGFLGVHLTDLTPERRSHCGAPADAGVMVSRVVPDSPAAEAGIQVGDILTRMDGEAVESRREVIIAVRNREAGETVELEVWRDGRARQLTASLAESERHALDVGRLFHPDARGLVYDIDTEAMGKAIERLKETVGDPEWRARVLRLRTIDEDLEERLEALEQRLLELEGKLDD
jgi:hypothetical protein